MILIFVWEGQKKDPKPVFCREIEGLKSNLSVYTPGQSYKKLIII